jgi:diguanylate cyclase (GGDEF)-like protein
MHERSAMECEQSTQARVGAAHQRDLIAATRDVEAVSRDQAADARDAAMAARDDSAAGGRRRVSGAQTAPRAAEQRQRAAEQRALSAGDRRASAGDRELAVVERHRTLAELDALARQLALAERDPLTGARTRAAGLADLDRELERCRRTSCTLVIVYVDVVGLKALNDSAGHAAGDELVKRVASRIAERLRPYDLIVRVGGDEFLCAMPNMTLAGARARFASVMAVLAGTSEPSEISVGFSQFAAGDTALEVIARADKEMIDSRGSNSRTRLQADRAGE